MNQPDFSAKDVSPVFRFRYNSTVALAAGLLLFLLPFAKIKCGTVQIAENTGVGMVTGKQWKVSFGDFEKDLFGDVNKVTGTSSKNNPQWFVAFAAFFALCGFVVSFSGSELRAIITMCAAILASVLLGGTYFHLKMQLRSMPFDDAYSSYGGLNFIKLKFTIWYYLSLVFFVAAAIFSYKHHRLALQDKIAATMLFEFQEEKETASASDHTEAV